MIVAIPPPDQTERRWAWRAAAIVLILGTAALRLLFLARNCPLDLAPDEAHYWDWSRHLDWSYYSKGPLVALLIRASCTLFGGWSRALTGTEMLAVRLPAVLSGSLLLASLYVLTTQVWRRERWALAAVGVALTLPLIAAGSSLMTIDAPFTCCWGWALVFGYQAIFRNSPWAWPATGVCVLLGILAKHTMVLWVPFFGLFLLATPVNRPTLWSGRFWLMTAIGALGGLPILIWNIQHDWVTFLHTKGHIGANADDTFSWLGPVRYVATQVLVLLGFWFVAWARASWAQRPWRASGSADRDEVAYLWWMSVPVFAFFLPFSFFNGGGEANWPVPAYIAGMALMVGWLARELDRPAPLYRAAARGGVALTCGLGLMLTIAIHEPVWLQPALLRIVGPPTAENPSPLRRLDPTCRLRGWHVLAAEVDRVREELHAQGEQPVLACGWWAQCGELAFYCAGQPPVYSLGLVMGDRHSQYDLWDNPLGHRGAFLGKTFIVVGADHEKLRPGFDSVEPLRMVTYAEDGGVIAVWSVTIARGYRGFPLPKGQSAF